jgi:hypothetical protein
MKLKLKQSTMWILVFVLLVSTSFNHRQATLEECTAGVACARATTDGRPILWKSRDAGDRDNEVIWNTSGTYRFIAVITARNDKDSWMGLNEKGFAIINTLSSDLGSDAAENGKVMTHALGTCGSVDDFEAYLKQTNVAGRKTATNYGTIDANGGAAFFETAANQYWRYDAKDTTDGYIVKTNFAIHGGGSGGIERYKRSQLLMKDFFASDRIDWKEIERIQVRDFSDKSGTLLSIPFSGNYAGQEAGYIPTDYAICRNITVSFAAIQGVLKGEPPVLSTMWTILGQPATGITVPYWPVGATPAEANGPKTAPLCDAANDIRARIFPSPKVQAQADANKAPINLNTQMLRDSNGSGIWKITLPVEDQIITEGEGALQQWRNHSPDATEMLALEGKLTKKALDALKQAKELLENNKR